MKGKNLIVRIERLTTSDQGTIGELFAGTFSCFTLELPWRNNQSNISCIPQGEYDLTLVWSNRFKKNFYLLHKVKDRFGVLIHSGNWAGDIALGYKTHSQGCILLGKSKGILQKQQAIFYSRPMVTELINRLNGQKAKLTIQGVI